MRKIRHTMDDRFFSISKRLLLAGICMGPLLAANQASAVPMPLSNPMLVPTDDRVAQTAGEPCFIGDSSCNNDSPTSYTNIGDHINGSDSAWDLSSPDYLVSEVREKIGNYFYIAIDVNEAAGASDNEYLDYLELWQGTHGEPEGGTLLYEYKPDSPFQLGNNPGLSNGTGWSDYYFTTLIDISSLLDEDYIHFDAAMSGITNGQEQLFVVPASVPVPAAAWLFGSGLIGLAGVARRRKAA